jgi:BirA family biotin operon repressor/biotin-[acetyl-CoA-carboxylase] ligase
MVEPIRISKLREGLRTEIIGRCILYFHSLTSTNYLARELAIGGAKEGTAVLAEIQTHGYGRLNRKWASPKGGVWLSIILRPRVEARHATKLTILGSIVVAHVIRDLYQLKPEVKWPNDVLINHKKVCGTLAETRTRDSMLNYVILGFGINADFSLETLPIYLRDSSTTIKQETRKLIQRESLLSRLLEETEINYRQFIERRFDSLLKEWQRLASFFGSQVRVFDQGEKIMGEAVGIDQDGALMVKLKDNTIRTIVSGDLRIVE